MVNPYEPSTADSDRTRSNELTAGELSKGFATVSVFGCIGGLIACVQTQAVHGHGLDGGMTMPIVAAAIILGCAHIISVLVLSATGFNLDRRFLIWNLPELVAVGLILSSPLSVGKIAFMLSMI